MPVVVAAVGSGCFQGGTEGAPEGKGQAWPEGGGGLVGDTGGASRDRKEASPMLMGWNLKSHSPCLQEHGQEIWFQPQLGH